MHVIEANELPAEQAVQYAGSRVSQQCQWYISGAIVLLFANGLQKMRLAGCRRPPNPAAGPIASFRELIQEGDKRIVARWPEALENRVVL